MKMSKCFSMPIRGECELYYSDEYHYNIYDNFGDILIPCLPEDVNGEAVVEAINNHDKLTGRVSELEAALSDVVDGHSKYDLVGMTGCSLERCGEIIKLLGK